MTAPAGWETLFDPETREVHVLPTDDAMIHQKWGTDCNCHPCTEQVELTDGGGATLVNHHALDGRVVEQQDEDNGTYILAQLPIAAGMLALAAALGALVHHWAARRAG